MQFSNKVIIGIGLLLLGGVACKVTPPTKEPAAVFEGFKQPANFPKSTYPLNVNPVTEEGFKLGKKLFYEGLLSRDGTISCGSCHISYSGFTHHGHNVSHGIDDKLGKRNSLAIQNLAWSNTFFWDGGVHNLDMVPFNPIENPVEMDEKVPTILEKLRKHPQYPSLFKAAFGSDEINTQRFMQALSQFMLMLISANSKYDKYIRNEGVSLTAEEAAGLTIFKQKCSNCHKGELFTDESFRNNGLAILGNDKGRFDITFNPKDEFCFKVPSLRNVEKTAPYMHDGRYATLERVLRHYAQDVQNNPTLDSTLHQNGILGIPLNETEQVQIIAFLKTLSDEAFVRNKTFAE